MLLLKYNCEEALPKKPETSDCCAPDKNPPDPSGSSGDCCYDTWSKDFKKIDAEFKRADKKVTWLTERLGHLQTQRDMWKTWKDELDKACDTSGKICDQLDMLLHHSYRVSRNIELTRRSINLLYCMVRDFFTQIDLLKTKYDYLVNCIKCVNNPALAQGQGIMLLITDYGKKLDAVIATRDNILALTISAVSSVNSLNKNIGQHHGNPFGLIGVLKEWKRIFNCEGKKEEENNGKRRYEGRGEFGRPVPEGEIEDIGLEPMLKFPICESWYYNKVEDKYKNDNREYQELSADLQEETKERDNLQALRDGLTSVISDPNVDPSKRCATK